MKALGDVLGQVSKGEVHWPVGEDGDGYVLNISLFFVMILGITKRLVDIRVGRKI